MLWVFFILGLVGGKKTHQGETGEKGCRLPTTEQGDHMVTHRAVPFNN